MPADRSFTLTDAQQERLLALRAAREEGEDEERLDRLRQREEDAETLRAVASLLAEADFAGGSDLTRAQMADLLALVRALAPNPNLDARLLRQPGEPGAFNRDLRALLFGRVAMPLRLRGFLARRHAGRQTALQLLCAAFPEEWPLVTQAGLRALEVSPEQRAEAIRAARGRYDLTEPGAGEPETGVETAGSDAVLRLLADVVLYEAVRDTLEAADYVAVHRLLTQSWGSGVGGRGAGRRRALMPLLYPPQTPDSAEPVTAREDAAPAYEADLSPSSDPGPLTPMPDLSGVAESDVLAYLEWRIAEQGFTYPPLAVRDYYISLQTKPFALLSGLSGTGKTRLTALFADALTGGSGEQYRLLPVRPDWADSTPLLGYVNLLAGGGAGRFVSTPFLDFLRRAERPENAHRAFFLCLDEMNLARVEHYFAEVLSAMETAGRELLLPDGRAARLPANLFFIGTLNIDEATHALSRKVLDRANTIVFQEVCLREDRSSETGESRASETLSPAVRQALFLQARVGTVAAARAKLREASPGGRDFADGVVNTLAEANALLEPQGLHFAYRVRDEVLRYCANSFDRGGRGLLTPNAPDDAEANLRLALNLQLQQKVLPRFTGTREQLEAPAQALLRWAETAGFSGTARRLTRLRTRLQRDGFASFDEA